MNTNENQLNNQPNDPILNNQQDNLIFNNEHENQFKTTKMKTIKIFNLKIK